MEIVRFFCQSHPNLQNIVVEFEHPVLQALNIPFNLLSAADPAARCRNFADANMENSKATHWFQDIEKQTQNGACLRHEYASTCLACPVGADFGILGTPCHPYSTQRQGRWREGSVETHKEFDISMAQCMDWVQAFQPAAIIFEQVLGFGMPFHSSTTETPLSRLHGCVRL